MSDTDQGAPPNETEAQRRERLEQLFEAWDERKFADDAPPDEALQQASRAWRVDAFRLWITMTLFVTIVAGWFMWLTRHEVAYWLQRDQPALDLGSLRAKFAAGERELDAPSNRYVKARELILTHESEAERPDADEEPSRFFLCPMFDIVVRTTQPFPDKPLHRAAGLEIPEDLVPLLEDKRAFPTDLAASIDITGRLVRARQAPRWHRKPLGFFARHARHEPGEIWLLLEGEKPERYTAFAVVWGLGILMILTSLGLLARGWSRRRRGLG